MQFSNSNFDDSASSSAESEIDADSDSGSSTSTAITYSSTCSRPPSTSSSSGASWNGKYYIIEYILFRDKLPVCMLRDINVADNFIDSPLKLTKRWRKNHEEEQMRSETIRGALFNNDDNRKPAALDLTLSPARSSNSSVVNWLTQSPNLIAHSPTPISTASSSISTSNFSSTSLSSSSSDDPFSCLYLLASAAVGELDRLKNTSVQNIALAVNS